ncbi:MAG: type IV conjugative transfer system protein TraL [Deferribacteraceae bacterium]|nr:type IV conjugative transfer system protein TraL [Deferribacteraceae bacterium]
MNYIPKFLNAQPQFLWWDADEFIILIGGTLIGIIFDMRIICILSAFIAQKIYAKSKDHKQVGFLYHKLYSLGLLKSPKVPPAYIKLYIK